MEGSSERMCQNVTEYMTSMSLEELYSTMSGLCEADNEGEFI